jgi:hypothetical protein
VAYNKRDMSPPPRCSSVAWRERLAACIRIARSATKGWSDQLRDRTTFAMGGRNLMSDPMQRSDASDTTDGNQAEGSDQPATSEMGKMGGAGEAQAPEPPAPTEPSMPVEQAPAEPPGQMATEAPPAMTEGAPSDLGQRFEAELRRVRDALTSAETAASVVGFQTTVTSGRIECDYDIEGDSFVFRSVSFELEF